MKKYRFGMLAATDKELCDDRQEIITELIRAMERCVSDAKKQAYNASLTKEERLQAVEWYGYRFAGLSDFLVNTMGVEVREDGFLYTQTLFNEIYFLETNLRVEVRLDKAKQEQKEEEQCSE